MNESERAQTYLLDEFFMGVAKKQRELYIYNILNSADEDIDLRERERLKLRGLEEFLASLESIAKQRDIDKKRKWVF